MTVLVSSIGLAVTAQAAPGPGSGPGPVNLPAGSYQFTTLRASFLAGTYPNQQFSIYVTDTARVSKPLVGPSTTVSEVQLNLNFFSPFYSSYCFLLTTPSDFSVAKDLSAATLKTTITAMTPTCYSNYPGPPLTVNATWTGTGPVAESQSDDEYTCGSYTSESNTIGRNNVGNATATVTPTSPNPVSATLAGLGSSDQTIHAEGVSLDTCPPAFASKGAGFGTQTPGSYRFVRLEAGANFQSTSGANLGVYVSNFTNTFQPDAGPATVKAEINLTVSIFSFNAFAFMCFVIPASDFTSTGVQAAALHTKVDINTTRCSPGPPSSGTLPLPLNLDVTWTGVGPGSTLQSEGSYRCQTYNQDVESETTTNNVTIAGTLTPAFIDNFASKGTLVNGDTQLNIKGVQSQACLVRA
jgi:hypothetical protein